MLAMGPRASSKGKCCHELVGCPAANNLFHSNVGRYLGGPKSDARNPVQLVRTRTLSSDLDDGRSRAKVSNGVTLGSLGKSRRLCGSGSVLSQVYVIFLLTLYFL